MSKIWAASAERCAFNARLRLALKTADCPAHAREIAARCNRSVPTAAVTEHAVRSWLRAEALPTQDRLLALAAALGVAPGWLRFGPDAVCGAKMEADLVQWRDLAADLAAMSERDKQLVRELLDLLLLNQASGRQD
jgi:transcriptional regulator with XRE-family HTH domain